MRLRTTALGTTFCLALTLGAPLPTAVADTGALSSIPTTTGDSPADPAEADSPPIETQAEPGLEIAGGPTAVLSGALVSYVVTTDPAVDDEGSVERSADGEHFAEVGSFAITDGVGTTPAWTPSPDEQYRVVVGAAAEPIDLTVIDAAPVTATQLIAPGATATATIVADLDGEAVLAEFDGSAWVDADASAPFVDGSATVTWSPESTMQYRIEAGGSATPPFVVAVGAALSVSAPAVVASGATTRITITTAPGWSGPVTMKYRTTSSWKTSSTVINVVNGVGTVSIAPTASRSYQFTSDIGASPVFSVSTRTSAGNAVTARLSAANYISGELVWVNGQATKSGLALGGAPVVIERQKVGTSTWTQVALIKARPSGWFTYRMRPSTAYIYRARVANTSAVSAATAIERTTANRTLAQRATELSWLLGAAKGSRTTLSASDLPAGVTKAVVQRYDRGMLVEVTRGSSVRTWYVYDRIGTKYESLKTWDGKLGLPMSDAKCGLMEGACVQRFTGGALYQNAAGVYVAYGTVEEVEILATARSQAPKAWPGAPADNKYNRWIGGSYAWCEVFVEWSAWASGHSGWTPHRQTYAHFIADLKSAGVLHYNTNPPVGAVALWDWETGTPTHSTYVTGREGGYLLTVEGNTSNGVNPTRGVWERKRPASFVWAWFWPHDYAAATD